MNARADASSAPRFCIVAAGKPSRWLPLWPAVDPERFVYGGRFVAKRALRSVPKIAAVQVGRWEPLPRAEERGGERSKNCCPTYRDSIVDDLYAVIPALVEVLEAGRGGAAGTDEGRAAIR